MEINNHGGRDEAHTAAKEGDRHVSSTRKEEPPSLASTLSHHHHDLLLLSERRRSDLCQQVQSYSAAFTTASYPPGGRGTIDRTRALLMSRVGVEFTNCI